MSEAMLAAPMPQPLNGAVEQPKSKHLIWYTVLAVCISFENGLGQRLIGNQSKQRKIVNIIKTVLPPVVSDH